MSFPGGDNLRTITVLDGPDDPVEYVGQVAAFGNPLVGGQEADLVNVNLLLPPENPWLCEYPFENLESSLNETLPDQYQFERDFALFVSINRCSAETKARVALQIQQQISPRLKLLLMYSTDPQTFRFVTLQADESDNTTTIARSDFESLAILFIPHSYAAGIDLRMRLIYDEGDPRLGWALNEIWQFLISVSAAEEAMEEAKNDGFHFWILGIVGGGFLLLLVVIALVIQERRAGNQASDEQQSAGNEPASTSMEPITSLRTSADTPAKSADPQEVTGANSAPTTVESYVPEEAKTEVDEEKKAEEQEEEKREIEDINTIETGATGLPTDYQVEEVIPVDKDGDRVDH